MTTDRPSHRSRREADLVAKLKTHEAEIARLRLAIQRAWSLLPEQPGEAERLLKRALEQKP